jgi:hypothetical protein
MREREGSLVLIITKIEREREIERERVRRGLSRPGIMEVSETTMPDSQSLVLRTGRQIMWRC